MARSMATLSHPRFLVLTITYLLVPLLPKVLTGIAAWPSTSSISNLQAIPAGLTRTISKGLYQVVGLLTIMMAIETLQSGTTSQHRHLVGDGPRTTAVIIMTLRAGVLILVGVRIIKPQMTTSTITTRLRTMAQTKTSQTPGALGGWIIQRTASRLTTHGVIIPITSPITTPGEIIPTTMPTTSPRAQVTIPLTDIMTTLGVNPMLQLHGAICLPLRVLRTMETTATTTLATHGGEEITTIIRTAAGVIGARLAEPGIPLVMEQIRGLVTAAGE